MHVPVESSNIRSLDYDPTEDTLHIRFHCKCKGEAPCKDCSDKGYTEYRYEGTGPHRYAAIRDSPSPGKAYHEEIRGARDGDGNFLFKGVKQG